MDDSTILKDLAADNPFIQDFCDARQEDIMNPFFKAFLQDLRFEEKESEKGGKPKGKEDGTTLTLSQTWAPPTSRSRRRSPMIQLDGGLERGTAS